MDRGRDIAATSGQSGQGTGAGEHRMTGAKTPRTARGERTLRALLDAAAVEFGEKGFHDGSISGITSRAGVADMSARVKDHVAPAMAVAPDPVRAEGAALAAFLHFAREHKEIYRIIDESEFVDPASFRAHYEVTAQRIAQRLRAAADSGAVRADVGDVHAWAIMGMNVFLGLRFGVWEAGADLDGIAATANDFIARGLAGGIPDAITGAIIDKD